MPGEEGNKGAKASDPENGKRAIMGTRSICGATESDREGSEVCCV